MSIWLAIPSARPNGGTIPQWKERGYRVAAWLDENNSGAGGICDLFVTERFTHNGVQVFDKYPGYACAVNFLCEAVLKFDPQAEWIVTGGDDVEPDKNHTPEEIAQQCSEHFGIVHYRDWTTHNPSHPLSTFGVMQPTGDRWANGSIDRICGSPWMGRQFCERMYGGKGPLFEGYVHMFPDEELFEVAKMLGVLWQRPDLIHLHNHWLRPTWPRPAKPQDCPEFLREANSMAHWNKYKALFQSRKAAGFPGHEPLPVEVCA